MKNKCDCYIKDRQLVDYTPLMKPIYKTVSSCFGTKERDECSCGGDRTKCDFYPEIREKAKARKCLCNTEDCLMVSFVSSPTDATVLMVSRVENEGIKTLKTFINDEALDLYNKLIGN